MATWEEARAQLLSEDAELATLVEASEPAYLVAREVLGARAELGISQAELARRMGTSQSVISRLENMEGNPSLRTVLALAKALDRELNLRFVDPAATTDAIVEYEVPTRTVLELMEALKATVVTRDEVGEVVRAAVAGVLHDAGGAVVSIDDAASIRSPQPVKKTQARSPKTGKRVTKSKVVASSKGKRVAARRSSTAR